MQFDFAKWHGCGNDFVMVNGFNADMSQIAAHAAEICDRNFGVGADGVIFALPSDKCDLQMRIFNSDGSEAEMCGNGIRCFARFVREIGLSTKDSFTVETKAGTIIPRIVTSKEGKTLVEVDMGKPVLKAQEIPVAEYGSRRVISEPLQIGEKTFKITCVSMGNPHCVIFLDDLDNFDIKKWGPILEKHSLFPRKTNVEFVKVIDRKNLRMRVWERGAAVTLACGTGACATLTAAVLNDFADDCAELQLDGGKLIVRLDRESGKVYMTGPAQKVFEGKCDDSWQ